jgi:hypothetical protein
MHQLPSSQTELQELATSSSLSHSNNPNIDFEKLQFSETAYLVDNTNNGRPRLPQIWRLDSQLIKGSIPSAEIKAKTSWLLNHRTGRHSDLFQLINQNLSGFLHSAEA